MTLSRNAPSVPVDIPPEIIRYVENSRNPIIFNREFIELVQRMNQMLKGRCESFGRMQSILAADIIGAMPELKDDVMKVLQATGGKLDDEWAHGTG
jgi:mediator of RNA polymerase II transcription subunit 10